MTLMLASVKNRAEAEFALANGADIIDCKDPARGALGALDVAVVREIVGAIAGGRPVSAVTGDHPADAAAVSAAAEAMAAAGADYVKVGLFPGGDRAACIRALAPLAHGARIVGVMFADRDPDFDLLESMRAAGFAGAMLDTAGKGAGRLFDHADAAALAGFVRACRARGLLTGLAGSLEAPDVPRLLVLKPDVLGFRGALCAAHDRTAGLDTDAFEAIRALIPRERRDAGEAAEPHRAHYWQLAARNVSTGQAATGESDRIFVEDLVLPVRIGAYGSERQAAQKVRFTVVAEVSRAAAPAQDMRDVVSYDIITDGIRMIVAAGHIVLAETLADQIANFVLGHGRVQRVTVKIEKLEAGEGRVGVEITRQRPAEIAKIYQLFPSAGGRGGAGE
ncbi:MAG: (5-formylfuran-3-yl)methyl phosphate synthase [Pseudolabrys sp.]